MNKSEILSQALTAREEEIEGYQINIDNYTLAIEHIDSLPDDEKEEMIEFRMQLAARLHTETHEQKKAKIMYAVIKKQVEVE